MKPIIRSITLFLGKKELVKPTWKNYVEEKIIWLKETSQILTHKGYKVFTERIVFPDLSREDKERIVDIIDDNNILISLGCFYFKHITGKDILDLVGKGYYITLYGFRENPVENALKISKILHQITSVDPLNATRVSIAFHNNILETPYFPDTVSSGVEGVGFSFLLPRHLIEYYEKHHSLDTYVELLVETINEIKDIVKSRHVHRVFFDYSISPWMDNSVVELIEKLGYKLLTPGFNYGIHILNKFIEKLIVSCGSSGGFNEVMLPYAEDNLLKKAGEKGYLRARDLLLYSISCVVGPDMIVVPESIDMLKKYILDTYSVWLMKKKPLALRIIPVSLNPGDKIVLGKFGEVYVINY